jgi:hypothetical protein
MKSWGWVAVGVLAVALFFFLSNYSVTTSSGLNV